MSILKIVAIIVALTLCSCASTMPPTVNTKNIVITIPDRLLQDCNASMPPSETVFLGKDIVNRQDILTSYSIKLLNDLKDCNSQIEEIKKFEDKQIILYSK